MITFKKYFTLLQEQNYEVNTPSIKSLSKIPKSPPYGFWMDRHGNLETVWKWAEHENAARRLVRHGKILSEYDEDNMSKILLQKGWARIVVEPTNQIHCETINNDMSTGQRKTLKYLKELYPELPSMYTSRNRMMDEDENPYMYGSDDEDEEFTKSPFAVFVVYQFPDGKIAATTRPSDRKSDDDGNGKYGLPGGKVDPGEDPMEAAIRESMEEGWIVENLELKHSDIVQGKLVWWYKANYAKPLKEYKEKYRGIIPCKVDMNKLQGFGNDIAIPKSIK